MIAIVSLFEPDLLFMYYYNEQGELEYWSDLYGVIKQPSMSTLSAVREVFKAEGNTSYAIIDDTGDL